MLTRNIPSLIRFLAFAALIGVAALASQAGGAADAAAAKSKERESINVLTSNAKPAEKALACKQLAVWGTRDAVPALAPLLADEQLASWARIALEAIPDSACDKALRDSLKGLRGQLLVGAINSVGVRRDPKAVRELSRLLNSSDPAVACAAADSLGRIGGSAAAKALQSYLPKSQPPVKDAVALGCIRCAEHFMKKGKSRDAVKLYDLVRNSGAAKQRTLEANRGAILARKDAGIPLLLEQLNSADKDTFNMALSTARELPGPKATRALADEIRVAPPERQPLLLLALADRGDAAAQPVILEAARSGSKKLRLTAILALDRAADPAALPVLLEIAASDDPDVSQAAKAAAVRLPGGVTDEDLLKRMPQAEGKMRPVLIEITGRRGMETALPWIVRCANNPDPATRKAALKAIGAVGGDAQLSDLLQILEKAPAGANREETSEALLAISGRRGTNAVNALLPLAGNSDPSLRIIGLQALAAAGGQTALNTVRAATEDQTDSVRDEAIRTLASWPSTWPEDSGVLEPLLAIAGSGPKNSYQILAARGYLQFLQGDKKLSAQDKLAKLNQVLPLLKRPEEKLLAISVLREIQNPEALQLLGEFASQPAVTEDACSALMHLAAAAKSNLPVEERRKALQLVVEKSGNETTKAQAEQALKKLP